MRAFFLLCIGVWVIGCSKNEIPEVIPQEEIVQKESTLPQIKVNTNNQPIPDDPKIKASLQISQLGEILYEGGIGIEIRGQSSQMFPKKQYGFETRDVEGEGIDVALLDFPAEEDWIFHAPYSDKTLMRNALMYDLSRAIGRYASRVQFVDFYLNGNYDGLYLLMEKLKRDKNRIDLNNLKPDENEGADLTGGYILKIDKELSYTEINSFKSAITPPGAMSGQSIRFLFEDPKPDEITAQQRTYITDYVSKFEKVLMSDSFANPDSGYSTLIDIPSFVDFFLLTELSNNVDGYRLSTYLTKDKNKKLAMGPIWDFNLAFGNANYCQGSATDVWAYKFNERCPTDFWLVPFWWSKLLQDAQFRALVKKRWGELRVDAFSEAQITNRLDTYQKLLDDAGSLQRNFARWPVLGTYVWPNEFIGKTHKEELDYMKSWISKRLTWLDGQIGAF
ncbi:MAG: CotH kinase family protein [Spirosomataceae bacterium]